MWLNDMKSKWFPMLPANALRVRNLEIPSMSIQEIYLNVAYSYI